MTSKVSVGNRVGARVQYYEDPATGNVYPARCGAVGADGAVSPVMEIGAPDVSDSATGSVTTDYVKILDWDCLGIGEKNIIFANSHSTNHLKYRMRGYAKKGSTYYDEIISETDLAGLTQADMLNYEERINRPLDNLTVEAKNSIADTAGYRTSGLAPALTLISLESAGTHVGGTPTRSNLVPVAGYHTSGASPATTLAALKIAGYHQGAVNPAVNISGGTNKNFKITVDGGVQTAISLTLASCDTGAHIAAEMQSKIVAALGAVATVAYIGAAPADYYKITSATPGASSAIAIASGDTLDVTGDLNIGAEGTSYAGVGTADFKINDDADGTPHTVTLTLTACTTGALTAAEMQTKIRALGGIYAAVGVAYGTTYVITSGVPGSASQVTITAGDTNPANTLLKIGVLGTSTQGITYDTHFKIAVDADAAGTPSYHAVTLTDTACDNAADIAAEMQTRIQALGGIYGGVTAVYTSGHYLITSHTVGNASKVLVAAGDTLDCTDDLAIGTGGTSATGNGNVDFKIAVDADAVTPTYTNVTMDAGTDGANLNTGLKIAAAMQVAIRLLVGIYANVAVTYTAGTPGATDYYTITSNSIGVASKVRVAAGTSNSCAALLKLSTGYTDTDGTTTAATYEISWCGGA